MLRAQIAKPSPSGGRINMQYRRVQCAPPQAIAISVDANGGTDGWIRLQVEVRSPLQLHTHDMPADDSGPFRM